MWYEVRNMDVCQKISNNIPQYSDIANVKRWAMKQYIVITYSNNILSFEASTRVPSWVRIKEMEADI